MATNKKTTIKWSKQSKDFIVSWHENHIFNAGFINDHILDKAFLEELKKRGYNVKTLKFEISKEDPNDLEKKRI